MRNLIALVVMLAAMFACVPEQQNDAKTSTLERVGEVEKGMTFREVTSLLGEPREMMALKGTKKVQAKVLWNDGSKTVYIFFENGVAKKIYS